MGTIKMSCTLALLSHTVPCRWRVVGEQWLQMTAVEGKKLLTRKGSFMEIWPQLPLGSCLMSIQHQMLLDYSVLEIAFNNSPVNLEIYEPHHEKNSHCFFESMKNKKADKPLHTRSLINIFDPRENQHFAYAKTKTQISFAVTAKLISAFVFAT